MKKLTLFLVAMLFSALSFAALNPYAYGLKSTFDGTTLTANYSLNADATGVSVVILNGETEVYTVACNDKKTKGSHSVNIDISTLGLPTGKSLTWKVVVTGNSVADPTLHDESIKFYLPYGMDVDVDPESDYLGQWYVIEATNGGQTKTGYQSNPFGRGLYAFDATLNPILNNAGTRGFLGGVNAGATETNVNSDYVNFYRVATSGGRVFIGRFRDGASYHPIVEANPADLNAAFTSVVTSGRAVSIDARGSGENLKLVMLGTDYKMYEYDLGTDKSIAGPSRTLDKTGLTVARDDASIAYDNEGGVWFNQNRGTATEAQPTIAHVSGAGVDYNNVKAGLTHNNTNNSGIAVSPDGKQLAVVGAGTKNITIYNINKTGGNITLTKAYTFAVSAGSNHTALAWDYAGNLFTANRSSECIRIFAMPYSGTVATPCASKYAFSLPAPPQLNPFAYKLSSELSADEKTLTINYSLNALATSVNWVLMDGETPIKTEDLSTLGLEKGDYTTTISTTDFPQYKALTWKIEVKGVAVNEPTEYPVNYSICHPSAVDIDNNPENPTFGLILTNEGMHAEKDNSKFISYNFGAGIFAFNPAFENIGKYNGGITFTTGRADGTGTAYAPRRIRISEDGRIFVTSLNTDGNYLWEVNPESMNEWTPVFNSASINDNKEIIDASDNFIVGPNVGFDIKGSGENLKLMMYSVNLRGITAAVMSGFKCAEYNLGNGKSWNTTPSKMWVDGKYAISYNGTQVEYDNEGGIWIASYRGTATDANPGLVHINKDGVEDAKLVWSNVRNAGIRFNHDYTKLVVAGYNGAAKKATIYAVSKDASGKPVLTEETVINMATVGNNLNDFAWDYANNLYACGNSSEKLAVWAMPHSSDDVVATPAASKYTFSIGKYTMTVNTNNENKGTVTGGGEYIPGATATITATPKDGYKLLYWSDRSTANPRTITMNKNEALSAYFVKEYDEEPTFTITQVWENTNVPTTNTNGYQAVGWDGKVYLQASADNKIKVYSNGTDAAIDYANSGAGYQIAVDEVGNMIVYNGYFATATPTNILIYEKGSTTGKAVTFTLPEPGRCDFFSASGNIYSEEGGYVYFYCQNTTVVNRLKIKNGAATDADVTVDVVGGNLVAGFSQNHVIKDIFGNLVAHSRTNGIRALNVVTNEVTNFYTLPNLKTNTLGGCSFELSGKEFWAYNMGTTAYTSEWNLYNVTDGQYISAETLCAKDKTTINANQAANWLNVQVVDEKTAYIYQYCPTVAVAVWKVTRDHIVSATAENGSVTGTGTYKDNETATLTATPNDGYLFKNWTKNGVVVSIENPYSFTVTEDVELVANFDGPFCELILNTNDEAKGTVSGAGLYRPGQTATIKATPAAGYKLLYWSDRSTQTTRTITMNKKEALSAYFVKVYDEEPTFAIEKVWENTNVPGSANNGFQAVGWDEKIYMKDRLGAAINVYTATGSELYVNTDAFTSEDALKGDQPIAIDDAGNIIIRSGSGLFYNAPKQVTIYKNGDKTGKVIDFTLPATGRCDFISASGDIYSTEGGYVYFYCMGQTTVSRLYIKNGGAGAADISVDEVGATLTEGSSQSHVFTNIFGDLMTHTRASVKVLQEVNAVTGVATTMTLPDFKESTLGGCSFELGGKELIAYNIKGTDYNSEWNLYNMTDKEFVSAETLYAKDRTSKKTVGAANWLNVQVVDEETAYIYQFCPEVAVAVWKVTLVETVVIDDKADNTTALAEYEGQKVTAKVTRAFNNDSYKTLTLPFDMNEEQIKAVFGETAKVHKFTSVGEKNGMFFLHFDPTTTIEAGTPYIIELPETGDYDAKDGFTIENVTIKTDLHSVQPVASAITMQPVLDGGGRLTQASEYWLASDNYLYSAGAHPTALLGLRAYFINSTGRPIRARVVYGENEATSIPTVVAPEDNVRKVLKDGQIIIIRGEKQYNIQGQVIE